MEAWPGAGTSVWCLLDKQAPGSGGVVDAYGAGDAPVLFLILFFVHTQTHPDTRTGSPILGPVFNSKTRILFFVNQPPAGKAFSAVHLEIIGP